MTFNAFLKNTAIAFVFILAYEWLVHGHLMTNLYVMSSSAFRPVEDMQSLLAVSIFTQVITAMVFVILFDKLNAEKTLNGGIAAGTILGLFLAVQCFGSYCYLPITITIALGWFAACLIQGAGIGLVLSLCNLQKDSGKKSKKK